LGDATRHGTDRRSLLLVRSIFSNYSVSVAAHTNAPILRLPIEMSTKCARQANKRIHRVIVRLHDGGIVMVVESRFIRSARIAEVKSPNLIKKGP